VAPVFVICNIHTYIHTYLLVSLKLVQKNVVFLTKSGKDIILFYVAFWNLGPLHDSVKWGKGGLDKSNLQERRPLFTSGKEAHKPSNHNF